MNDAYGDPRNYDPNDPYWNFYDYDSTWGPEPPPPSQPGTQWTSGLVADLASQEGSLPAPGTSPNVALTPTPTTGGSTKTLAQIKAEGEAYDAKMGFKGGYMNGNVWVNGSPSSTGGAVTGPGGPGGAGGEGWGSTFGSAAPERDFPSLDLPTWEGYDDYVPEEWKAPEPGEVFKDPSYEFRFNEGVRPITNSRAARGLTQTGATLKELTRYGQNFGSNEYDRIYDRAADSYDRRNNTRQGAWRDNRQNRIDGYDRRAAEAGGEFAPKQRWAELQYGRDFDLYKYQNDDAFRRHELQVRGASSGASNPPPW